jgi:hypothetical protein
MLKCCQRFKGTCHLHLQYQRTSFPPAVTLVSFLAYFFTLKMDLASSSKSKLTVNRLHDVISKKTRDFHNLCCENSKSCFNLFTTATNSFLIWNCSILKTSYFSYTTTFHIAIIHEHLLHQCVTHAQHFNTLNNTTRLQLFIAQVKCSSNSNI